MATAFKDPDIGKAPEQLLQERAKRLRDVFTLQKPDRVPIALYMSYMLAEYGGVTKQVLHDNPQKQQEILEKAVLDFQPDAAVGVFNFHRIPVLLGDRTTKFPGYGIGPNDAYQFVESDYMKAEEYSDFLLDPSDWIIRVYLPRITAKLSGLSKLGSMALFAYGPEYANFTPFADPEVGSAMEALKQAGQIGMGDIGGAVQGAQRLAGLGFPPSPLNQGLMALAPFDIISDFLRGMKGSMLDMHRHPDQLLEATDKIRRIQTKEVIANAKALGMPYTLSMLHRGSDGFMSLEQFERFYWPSLKRMWLDFIDAGLTPWVFFEGTWDERLKYLAELPKGKVIGWFQSSDIFKVKEVLGNTLCVWGGMPNSLLQGGTVEEVRDYTKLLCDKVGRSGGFIMCTQIGEMEGSRPELVRAWVQATKEFGRN